MAHDLYCSTDIGLETSVASINLAAHRALESLYGSCPERHGLKLGNAEFMAVWIGLAGYDRPEVACSLYPALSTLFKICDSGELRVSNDIDVLATAAGRKGGRTGTDSAIVLIAGTGSVAMRYIRSDNDKFVCDGRSGGWGHLLGDDGGGFDLGRQGIRSALSAFDELRITNSASTPEQFAQIIEELPALPKMVVQHFCPPDAATYDVLSNILMGDGGVGTDNKKKAGGDSDAKSRISRVGQLVMEAAEGNSRVAEDARDINQRDQGDTDAEAILAKGVSGLIQTVKPLLRDPYDAGSATLVLSGSLLTSGYEGYRAALLSGLEQMGVNFRHVRVVKNPAELGAHALAESFFGVKVVEDF